MGYKERERYLDREYYDLIFDRSGNSTSMILLDGRVIGVWEYEKPVMKFFLFNNEKKFVRKKIILKLKKLSKFFSGDEARIREIDYMVPLSKRTAGGFMSPLKKV